MASAMEVLMALPEATEERLVSLVEVWKAIEEVVPREKLASAVETVAAFVPVSDDDAAAQWRAELVKRYRTVQGFIEPLLSTIRFRAVEAGTPVLAMVRAAAAMAKSRRRYAPGDIAAHDELITGSWRPLVYRNPDLPDGQVDKAAFVLCALMHLHTALRRRDVFAEGSERWSDPRARLLLPRARAAGPSGKEPMVRRSTVSERGSADEESGNSIRGPALAERRSPRRGRISHGRSGGTRAVHREPAWRHAHSSRPRCGHGTSSRGYQRLHSADQGLHHVGDHPCEHDRGDHLAGEPKVQGP